MSYAEAPTRRRLLVAAALLALARGPSSLANYTPRFSAEPNLVASQMALEQAARLQSEGVVLGGCGWMVPRDLEFLLPRLGNFVDVCDGRSHRGAVLIRDRRVWQWNRDPGLERAAEQCQQTIFSADPYTFLRCEPN